MKARPCALHMCGEEISCSIACCRDERCVVFTMERLTRSKHAGQNEQTVQKSLGSTFNILLHVNQIKATEEYMNGVEKSPRATASTGMNSPHKENEQRSARIYCDEDLIRDSHKNLLKLVAASSSRRNTLVNNVDNRRNWRAPNRAERSERR